MRRSSGGSGARRGLAGLAAAAGAVLALALLSALPVLAADATATPGPAGGDPRSSGQGPGLVGDPLFAIGAVLAIGLLSIVLTVAWVRLTDPNRGARRP